MKETHILTFSVREHLFSLALDQVKEVVHIAELYKPPGTPSFIEGFLNLENSAIPVLSLSKLLFSTPPLKHIYSPLIVLDASGRSPSSGSAPSHSNPHPWAVLVDKVMEIKTLPAENLLPVNEELVFSNCVTAVSEIDGEKVYLLAPGQILLRQEEERIAEFLQVAQKRIDKTRSTSPRKQKKKHE